MKAYVNKKISIVHEYNRQSNKYFCKTLTLDFYLVCVLFSVYFTLEGHFIISY